MTLYICKGYYVPLVQFLVVRFDPFLLGTRVAPQHGERRAQGEKRPLRAQQAHVEGQTVGHGADYEGCEAFALVPVVLLQEPLRFGGHFVGTGCRVRVVRFGGGIGGGGGEGGGGCGALSAGGGGEDGGACVLYRGADYYFEGPEGEAYAGHGKVCEGEPRLSVWTGRRAGGVGAYDYWCWPVAGGGGPDGELFVPNVEVGVHPEAALEEVEEG